MDNLTVERQLALEDRSSALGIKRYEAEKDRQEETALSPGRKLLCESVIPLADAIKADLKAAESMARRKNPSIYTQYLSEVDPLVAAYITARTCINMCAGIKASVTRIAMTISTLLHEHKLFDELRQAEPGLFNFVENQINNTVPERQRWAMRRATELAEQTVTGLDWGDGHKLRVGVKLIELFAEHTGLVQDRTIRARGKNKMMLEPTEKMVRWLESQHEGLKGLTPMYKPMLIPPIPWTNPKDGGYLQFRLDLIKSDRHERIDEYFSADMPEVYSAVNALQETPWRINPGVLNVLREAARSGRLGGLPSPDGDDLPARPRDIPQDVPLSSLNPGQKRRLNKWRVQTAETHTRNARERSKRLSLNIQLLLASEFSDEKFYFPYQLDFRGRIYAVPPVLNPQGDNVAKGLLCFAEGKPLGEHGAYWLAVHIANEFGHDKVSFDERVQWVLNNEELILDSALDPLDGARFWTTADSPWTALAACFEWAGYKLEGNDYVSYLPIGMDGSCSGLQHFSALLRDPVGGAAVNLLPSDEKADIYQTVADAVSLRLDDPDLATNEIAQAWRGHVDRKIVKQPCMTFAYSSTVHGMRDQIIAALRKYDVHLDADHYEAAMFLAPIVRECIQQTVVAASKALDWLQGVAHVCTDKEEAICWTSPVGLPVIQDRRIFNGVRVKLIFQGRTVKLQLQVRSRDLNRRAQINGISPNYVHSLDSAHLMKTVNACMQNGVQDFAMIHDSFGCHACDIDVLHEVLRREFVAMYQYDWLTEFRAEVLEQLKQEDSLLEEPVIDPPPEFGTLEIESVMDSDFFFS